MNVSMNSTDIVSEAALDKESTTNDAFLKLRAAVELLRTIQEANGDLDRVLARLDDQKNSSSGKGAELLINAILREVKRQGGTAFQPTVPARAGSHETKKQSEITPQEKKPAAVRGKALPTKNGNVPSWKVFQTFARLDVQLSKYSVDVLEILNEESPKDTKRMADAAAELGVTTRELRAYLVGATWRPGPWLGVPMKNRQGVTVPGELVLKAVTFARRNVDADFKAIAKAAKLLDVDEKTLTDYLESRAWIPKEIVDAVAHDLEAYRNRPRHDPESLLGCDFCADENTKWRSSTMLKAYASLGRMEVEAAIEELLSCQPSKTVTWAIALLLDGRHFDPSSSYYDKRDLENLQDKVEKYFEQGKWGAASFWFDSATVSALCERLRDDGSSADATLEQLYQGRALAVQGRTLKGRSENSELPVDSVAFLSNANELAPLQADAIGWNALASVFLRYPDRLKTVLFEEGKAQDRARIVNEHERKEPLSTDHTVALMRGSAANHTGHHVNDGLAHITVPNAIGGELAGYEKASVASITGSTLE